MIEPLVVFEMIIKEVSEGYIPMSMSARYKGKTYVFVYHVQDRQLRTARILTEV